ncbi:MAG: hypothetical protein F2667_03995, partial [Actinobacteria bacterium]|nr:hypothetical protein [Actinomycetota bacterium]
MLRRALTVLLAGCLAGAGALVGGADPARAGAEPATPLVVTGYALGSANDALIARNAPGLSTLTVAGVSITARGGSVSRPTADLRRLVATAHDEGLRAELLLSNYSNRLGGFDSEAVARMLADERKIARVAEAVAGHASDGGWDGVNVDLESMDADDA